MNTPNSPLQSAAGDSGANIVGVLPGDGPGPDVMAAGTLTGDKVVTTDGEHVGHITGIMLDVRSGCIAYAVLSAGGFLGMGNTLHAIPWGALTLNIDEKLFLVHITADEIKNAPGFDKDHWPSMADPQLATAVHRYFGREPYWLPR